MRSVYIAGPFRAPNAWEVERNVRRAEELAYRLITESTVPVLAVAPHSLGRFFNGTMTAEYWLEATLELMRRCDAVLVLDGWESSSGTRGEIAEARRLGMPVFYDVDLAIGWVETEAAE